MEQPKNPYSAPEVQTTLEPQLGSPLSHIANADVKKLRSNSHSIRAIGVLVILGFILICLASLKAGMDSKIEIFGLILPVAAFLAIIATINAVGVYALLARPSWGQVVGIIFCAIIILNLSIISIILGVLGIIALSSSQKLFGADKITHKAIDKEFKMRKKAKQI